MEIPNNYGKLVSENYLRQSDLDRFVGLYSRLPIRPGMAPLARREQDEFVGLQKIVLEARIRSGDYAAKGQLSDFEIEVTLMTALQEPLGLGYL
ncbi:MAG: hypothetical protein AABY09_02145 [Nanoarchaeota archaeon]